jgi:hypothetical protein
VKAAGVKLEPEVMKAIDKVLAKHIVRDPKLTISPKPRA